MDEWYLEHGILSRIRTARSSSSSKSSSSGSSSKGEERKGHKYISREWKNGRWNYTYKEANNTLTNKRKEATYRQLRLESKAETSRKSQYIQDKSKAKTSTEKNRVDKWYSTVANKANYLKDFGEGTYKRTSEENKGSSYKKDADKAQKDYEDYSKTIQGRIDKFMEKNGTKIASSLNSISEKKKEAKDFVSEVIGLSQKEAYENSKSEYDTASSKENSVISVASAKRSAITKRALSIYKNKMEKNSKKEKDLDDFQKEIFEYGIEAGNAKADAIEAKKALAKDPNNIDLINDYSNKQYKALVMDIYGNYYQSGINNSRVELSKERRNISNEKKDRIQKAQNEYTNRTAGYSSYLNYLSRKTDKLYSEYKTTPLGKIDSLLSKSKNLVDNLFSKNKD